MNKNIVSTDNPGQNIRKNKINQENARQGRKTLVYFFCVIFECCYQEVMFRECAHVTALAQIKNIYQNNSAFLRS